MNKQQEEDWIKLLGPSCSEEEIKAVTEVLKSGWWGLGPVTEQFEKEFAKFVGAKYAVALNSCTSGLHLALHILNKKSKEKSRRGKIITPAFTFVSTAAVAIYEGMDVVFADIDETSYCLDPEDVRRKIDKDTVAIIPVHYAGRLADMSYGSSRVPIIEDCAHAVGTKGAGKRGILSTWSFHPVKNIATGDAGMITTDNKGLAERIRKLRWLGIDLSTYEREKKGYNWEYHIKELGYKYHTNDIMSAIGLAQLRRVKKMNRRRKQIAERYNKELDELPVVLPPSSDSWHLYVIRVDKKYRNKLVDFLRERKISPGVHYKPLHHYSIFNWEIRQKGKELPVTERIWQEVISLPIYPDLTEEQQERVITVLKEFFSA